MNNIFRKKTVDNEKPHSVKNYFFMLKLVFKVSPALVVLMVALDALMNLPWTLFNVVILKYVIDVVTEGTDLYRIGVVCVVFSVFVFVLNVINTSFYELNYHKQKQRLHHKIYSMIYEKAARMDISSYDNPKFYNDFVLAMNMMEDRAETVIEDTQKLVTNFVSLTTIVSVIVSIDPVCLLFVVACIAIMVPMGRVISKIDVKRKEAMTPLDRKNLYFQRVFYLQDYAKELRLNPYGEMIDRRYKKNVVDRLKTISPFLRKQWQLYFCQESLPMTLIINFGVCMYMGYQAIVKKEVSLGDFVATFNGVSTVSSSVFFLTSWFTIHFRENGYQIEKFRRFMDAEETIKSGTDETVHNKPVSIKFNNVSFTYPGNDKPTLKNISFEIKPYQKIALVGYNGAGKTTLTNLLLRLYDVTDGSITVDGKDIREWDKKAYHRNFAAVFQDFALFGASLGENVSMNSTPDKQRVEAALRESNFSKTFENGTDTILLREFDDNGVSLSGGEAQKVAVSRVFYKDCPFAILDEPSANLDPVSEYALNEAMVRASKEKSVIFISHRLSTTVMADVIYMLENGEIVESGSHEELMAKNGKYAYMFNLQADKYKA